MQSSRAGVSNIVFAVSVIVLIVIAAAGFGLYATAPGSTGAPTHTTVTQSGSTPFARPTETGGYNNDAVGPFVYPYQYKCLPSLTKYFSNETTASALTQCEVGEGDATAEQGAASLWVIVPAFAGLSIFGAGKLGASPEGFPVYNNQTIVTQCGASGTPSGCPDHPLLLYSPFFTAVEEHLGLNTGYGGLPEGVLPTPAHDHLIDCCFQTVPWYTIVVLVFDPNIFPNAVTGQCAAVAPSNLTDPTGDCLSNYSGLLKALTAHDSGVSTVNVGNPIWQTLGGPNAQVVIPGAATASQIANANSNLFEHFTVNATNYYLPCSNGNLTACK